MSEVAQLLLRKFDQRQNPDHKIYTEQLAIRNQCEGRCAEHTGNCKSVQIIENAEKIDWGFFSYCEYAREHIARNGHEVIEVSK